MTKLDFRMGSDSETGSVSVTGSDLEKGSDSQTDLDSETGPVSGMVDGFGTFDRVGFQNGIGISDGSFSGSSRRYHPPRRGQSQTRNLKGTGTGRWLHVLTVAMTYDTQVGMTMKPFRGRK